MPGGHICQHHAWPMDVHARGVAPESKLPSIRAPGVFRCSYIANSLQRSLQGDVQDHLCSASLKDQHVAAAICCWLLSRGLSLKPDCNQFAAWRSCNLPGEACAWPEQLLTYAQTTLILQIVHAHNLEACVSCIWLLSESQISALAVRIDISHAHPWIMPFLWRVVGRGQVYPDEQQPASCT